MNFKPYIKFLIIGGVVTIFSFVVSSLVFSTIFASIERKEPDDRCGEVFLEWDPVERAKEYELYRDDELIYKGEELQFLDRYLIMGDTHSYNLKAVNKSGESELSRTSSITVSRPCPPERPEDVVTHDMPCGGYVYFEWESVPRATVYEVSRNPVPGFAGGPRDWMEENTVYRGPETEFFEGELKEGAWYSYKIRAGNDSGWSEWTGKLIKASDICPPSTPLPPRER